LGYYQMGKVNGVCRRVGVKLYVLSLKTLKLDLDSSYQCCFTDDLVVAQSYSSHGYFVAQSLVMPFDCPLQKSLAQFRITPSIQGSLFI